MRAGGQGSMPSRPQGPVDEAMQTGELIYHFINTIIVAGIVSAAVLWRYRVGVMTGMRVRGGVDLLPAVPRAPPRQPWRLPPATCVPPGSHTAQQGGSSSTTLAAGPRISR